MAAWDALRLPESEPLPAFAAAFSQPNTMRMPEFEQSFGLSASLPAQEHSPPSPYYSDVPVHGGNMFLAMSAGMGMGFLAGGRRPASLPGLPEEEQDRQLAAATASLELVSLEKGSFGAEHVDSRRDPRGLGQLQHISPPLTAMPAQTDPNGASGWHFGQRHIRGQPNACSQEWR